MRHRGFNKYRASILTGIGLLVCLFITMATILFAQLKTLSTASSDSLQWGVAQLETEFANLDATLARHLLNHSSQTEQKVRLRLDIALSRTNVMRKGRNATTFSDFANARSLLDQLAQFEREATQIVDETVQLTPDHIAQLAKITRDVRPVVRRLSLLGNSIGASESGARRERFATQLRWTGGIAIALMAFMAAMLLIMDRLVSRTLKNEAELRTSSNRLSSILSASLDAIVTTDDTGRIVAFNEAAEKMLGWRSAEVIGRTVQKTFIPEWLQDTYQKGINLSPATEGTKIVDSGLIEFCAVRKSGDEFPIEMNVASVTGSEGKRLIAYLRDISERKRAEKDLIDARDRAEQTEKLKSKFLMIMSHEMRTPLNGMLGVLDLLMTTRLTQKQKRYVQIASASGEVLLNYTNEALDITQIEDEALQLVDAEFDLVALVENLIDALTPLASEKDLALSLKSSLKTPAIFLGDANRIRQILTNLIGNAIKFTQTGAVTLTLSESHDAALSGLKLMVSDTGPGIAQDQLDVIFEDFVTLAQGAGRQTRGDGLGLAISRKIARQMGGDITVTSSFGTGSDFTLHLPLNKVDTTSTPVSSRSEQIDPATRPLNILVVEDHDVNRSILVEMLGALGHQVTEAKHGGDAIDRAYDQFFDLIFMDISMPVMGGLQATKHLRNGDSANSSTRIIGLTAHRQDEFGQDAEAAGMNGLYSKPIRIQALRDILEGIPFANAPIDVSFDQALEDLHRTLGPAKLHEILTQFFDELASFNTKLTSHNAPTDLTELAEAAHRLRGAAAMLGLSTVEPPLTHIENDCHAGKLEELQSRAPELHLTIRRVQREVEAYFDAKA